MASYPSSPGMQEITVTSKRPVDKSIADDGSMQVRVLGAHRFQVEIKHPPMTADEYFPIDAFIMGLRGKVNTCTLVLPDKATPLGAATGSAAVNADYLSGATSVFIDGLAAGVTGALYASDFIKFANHTKVYKIVSTVDTGIGNVLLETGDRLLLETGDILLLELDGQVAATIAPALRVDVPNDTAVTYSNVAMTVKLSGDVHSYKVAPPNIYQKTVKFIEAF